MPITDLLGPDGHEHCEGYRLANHDLKQATHDRDTWLHETRTGAPPSVARPLLVPVDFRGGTVEFRFKANAAKTGYEIVTMFPAPPDQKPEHP